MILIHYESDAQQGLSHLSSLLDIILVKQTALAEYHHCDTDYPTPAFNIPEVFGLRSGNAEKIDASAASAANIP